MEYVEIRKNNSHLESAEAIIARVNVTIMSDYGSVKFAKSKSFDGDDPDLQCRRGCLHICRYLPDLGVDLVKHPVEIA